MSEERMIRMESKIDKLVEAVLLMSSIKPAIDDLEDRAEKVEGRVHVIELKMPLVDLMLKVAGKVGYSLIGLVLVGGGVGSYFVF